jgi:large subunit ribosomal protein L22
MAKGHRSQIKSERNEENRENRARCIAKNVRISDLKARIVLDQIKGKRVVEAEAILLYSPRYAAGVILKVLKSAIANAENNMGLDPDDLYVQEVHANRGQSRNRWRLNPRARGSAHRIERKVSHISVFLNEVSKKK